jgi:hypothetical protein
MRFISMRLTCFSPMINQQNRAGSGKVLKRYPVKIFKNTVSLECVADFRVPLEPIDILSGQRNRLCTTEGGMRETGKSFRYPCHLVGMGSPDIDLVWIPGKNTIVLADLYLDWAIPASLSRMNFPTEFCCNNMKPKADSQHRQPKIEILAGVPRSFYRWSTPENDPSAFSGYLLWGN